jgi:SAM-dependent methyltransferase
VVEEQQKVAKSVGAYRLPGMNTFTSVQSALKTAMAEDIAWLSHGRVPGQKPDPTYNPWMPFQCAEFVAMLAECVAEAGGDKFLDVGSGIGTKLLLAKELFGLNAQGLEYDSKMAAYANRYHRSTVILNALDVKPARYAYFDVIWLYRPFRDGFKQAQLEHLIFEHMKPGAIIAGAAWENKPNGFELIIDDLDEASQIRGAWRKPLGFETVSYDLDADELS